jgi:pilus assembly protein CpaF
MTSALEQLAVLFHDPHVIEVMINEDGSVYAEKVGGALERQAWSLSGADLDAFLKSLGPQADGIGPARPYADMAAVDGSRVHVIAPPLTRRGTCVTVRKRPARRPSLDEMVSGGSLSPGCAGFLRYAVSCRKNILIAGGASSGKTTLLNALASLAPASQRFLVLEDVPELVLPQPHVVYLKTRLRDPKGLPDVGLRELVLNALRMRPDRLILGECRGLEAWDMLQAMNVGHEGVLSTLHANAAREALQRLETLVLTAGFDIPLRAVRAQIASALDIIVFTARFEDGSRKILQVAELTGIELDNYTLAELFAVQERKAGTNAPAQLKPTGTLPRFYELIRLRGGSPPIEFFQNN